jgi:hypothetical protein
MSADEICATCGGPLRDGYFYLLDRPERYCAACIRTRPRCDTCAAPLAARHWRLHDGRLLCARCHQTGVFDVAEAQRLYAETVAALARGQGLAVRAHVAFRLVDAPTLRQAQARGAPAGHTPDARTLGLYQRQGEQRTIYVLYGIPRLLFRTVVAHEYAHAWQSERCPGLGEELREGSAEWVAYRHLLDLGCTRAARRMLTANHPYRPAFERVLELEKRLGAEGLLAYLQRQSPSG